jgi:hypothetical protein
MSLKINLFNKQKRIAMQIEKNKLVPKWFTGTVYEEGDIVKNPDSGEAHKLNPIELSIFDYAIGLQHLIEMNGGSFSSKIEVIQNELQKCFIWFRANNSEAYSVLLNDIGEKYIPKKNKLDNTNTH